MDSPDSKPDPVGFRTTEGGRPAKSRFTSASSLRTVYRDLKEKDEEDAKRRARIKNVYNGNFPYDPRKRKELGLGNLANFNSNELKGVIDARAASVHDMALDTTPLVELRPLPAELSGPDAEKIAEVVADEFSTVLRESRKFLPVLSTMIREAELYGLGPVAWPTYEDYQPEALERGQLKFAEDAFSVSSENDLYMVESIMPAWYLCALLDDPEGSASAGWNLAAVRAFLVKTFEEHSDTRSEPGDTSGTSTHESAVDMMRQNRLLETHQFDSMHVVHAYVREVREPRRVTHYIVTASCDVDDFLFEKKDAYDSMDQCLLWLPYSVTERRARGIRGLASFLYPIASINNRLLCQIYDVAFRSASYIMMSSVPGQNQQLTIVEHGPYTIVPSGLTPAQSQVTPQFQQLAAVREMGRNVSNNAAMGASGPGGLPERVYSGADRKTKDQVRLEAEAGAKVERSAFILRAATFDALFRESFRRFMKLVRDKSSWVRYPDVKLFVDRCGRRGVDIDILRRVPEDFSVHMCRDLVTGGAGAKADILMGVLQELGGNLDEPGRLLATRDVLHARLGRKAADRYRPEIGRDTSASDAASHATLENNDMLELSQVLAAPDQLHWTHIPIHWQIVEQIAQAAMSGRADDPQRMLDILQTASEHIQAHLMMGGSQIGVEGQVREVEANIRSLAPVIKALTLAADAQQRSREAEARAEEEEMAELRARAEGKENEVKIHEIDTKAALKMREQDQMQQVRIAAAEGKTAVEMLRARSKADIDRTMAGMRRRIEAAKITGRRPPQVSPEEGVAQGGLM